MVTFITKGSGADIPKGVIPPFGLSQRGRASLEILGSIQKMSASQLRPKAAAQFAADDEGQEIIAAYPKDSRPDALRAQIARARTVAERDPLYRLDRFLQRYVAEENFNRGIPAVEERRTALEAFLKPDDKPVVGALELDPAIEKPKYYTDTEWHLEPGGWDGYDLYGAMFAYGVGPYVFRHGGYAAVGVGEDINEQRVAVVRQLPKARYERVYEPGCGGISVAMAVKKVHPEAEFVGSDLSPLLLRMGHLMAERRGLDIALKQRELLDTGEPDDSFDAVVNYALQHELPPKVNVALFQEMFRILKPGGDMVLSDPAPFRAVDPFHAVILDWETKHRGEPFFSANLLCDWDEELRKIGFVDVQSFGLGKYVYPWVTRATKPL
jgi:SAM-dependent methyltransferase